MTGCVLGMVNGSSGVGEILRSAQNDRAPVGMAGTAQNYGAPARGTGAGRNDRAPARGTGTGGLALSLRKREQLKGSALRGKELRFSFWF